jgi:hypothetical protein
MLQISPMRWFSWDFTVERDDRVVAELDISWWRERGALLVDREAFSIVREGVISSDFRMTASDGTVVATASKPSVLRRCFEVVHAGHTVTLGARSAWGRTMDVHLDGRAVGAITPAGAWSRRAFADLPASLPLPVQVFVVWLAVLLWKREQDAAAAAS